MDTSEESSELKQKFLSLWPEILDAAVMEYDRIRNDNVDPVGRYRHWHRTVLEYTVPGGKMTRGMAVLQTYQLLRPNATASELKKAAVLGWCIEIFQASCLIADDIMDQSETRRGELCWYKVDDVGLKAINDSLLVERTGYRILCVYFNKEPCYAQLFDLFSDITMNTIYGQGLDLMTAMNLDDFTADMYRSIVTYKTAYYTFYLPVVAAIYLSGGDGNYDMDLARKVLLKIGEYFQVQDDYLDCYGDPDVTGKVGSDIREGKCTWLAVEALKKATEKQRDTFRVHYGRDEGSEEIIKELYAKLGIQELYHNYEEGVRGEIYRLIDMERNEIIKTVYGNMVRKIYKRSK